jgi:hypothetical protein
LRDPVTDVEVHTGVSLSADTSPITKRMASLNPKINSDKCEHPYQVEDLNPGGQVPSQETQLVELALKTPDIWSKMF